MVGDYRQMKKHTVFGQIFERTAGLVQGYSLRCSESGYSFYYILNGCVVTVAHVEYHVNLRKEGANDH